MSIKAPNTLPDTHYSLVEICYTSSLINSVKGIYVGGKKSETTECIFMDIDFKTILIGISDDSYSVRIRKYIRSLDEVDKNNIIHYDEIIDFRSEPKEDILEKMFLIGLGSILVYYHFMTVNQDSIGYPFDPIRIDFPVEKVSLIVLDQNVYEYLSYPAKILVNISIKTHGKLWMVQIMNFWNGWGFLFPKELDIGKDKSEIIYESIVGYSNHLYSQSGSIYQHFKSAEDVISTGCYQIEEVTKEALVLINGSDVEFKKKFKYAALLITVISTMVLKTIKAETDLSLYELIDSKEKSIKSIENISGKIKQWTNDAIDDIDTVRLSTTDDLKIIANNYVQKLDFKMGNIHHVMEEIRKHLKIYATENIQELHHSKSEVIARMYEHLPKIVDIVRRDVGKIINNNIQKRIESTFSDVLCEYREKAENRLSEVLNPVVARKVNIFKEDVNRSINQARSQADRARLQANRAEDLVMSIGCLEKRLKDLETGISETSIQNQIDEIKDDVEYLKDMIRNISRSLNIKC